MTVLLCAVNIKHLQRMKNLEENIFSGHQTVISATAVTVSQRHARTFRKFPDFENSKGAKI